jgi:opacity protein-like surface antigen
MINKNKTCLGVTLATLTLAGVLVSPQAAALTKAERMAEAANSKAEVLEAQLRAMQDEIAALRAQVSTPAPAADAAKVQELDQWMASVKSEPVKAKNRDENLIFFRGGYDRNDSKRNDLLTGNQFAGNALGGGTTNKDGYYVGAGIDFGLTDDVWGFLDDTQVLAELNFEYINLGQKNFTGAAPGAAPGTVGANPLATLINLAAVDTAGAPGLAGTANTNRVTPTQFTLSASPKIKFLKGSAFQPWIIPIGLAISIISPPSNGVTYINPGALFGTGAEYTLWKAFKLGADVRYTLSGKSTDGVNTNGLTAGGYLGIGF